MKSTVYLFMIICVLLTASFASAKEISCYSATTDSWFVTEGITCENKLFNLQDLKLLTSNFDRTDCRRANTFCAGSDINHDGVVNGSDLVLFTPSFCAEGCSIVPVCGDLVCEGDEDCDSCEVDCGKCEEPETHGGSGGGSSRSSSGSVSMTILDSEVNSTNSSNLSETSGASDIEIVTEEVPSETHNNSIIMTGTGSDLESEQVSGADSSDKGMAGTGMVAGDGTGDGKYKTTLTALIALLVVILGAIVFVLYRRAKRNKRR